MILDSSAVVAILRSEPDAAIFAEATESDPLLRISAANYLAVCMVIESGRNPAARRRVDDFFNEANVIIEPVTVEQAAIAREAFRDFPQAATVGVRTERHDFEVGGALAALRRVIELKPAPSVPGAMTS